MLLLEELEALRRPRNVNRVMGFERVFYLDIHLAGFSVELHILVPLDQHFTYTGKSHQEWAAHSIQMLIKKTIMNRLNAL